MHFDGPKLFCPTNPNFSNVSQCHWSGSLLDLKHHVLEEHLTSLLTDNVLIIKRDFLKICRGFFLKDTAGNMYCLNVCYHIDNMLYFKVIPMADGCETRRYRVTVTGASFELEIGTELGKCARFPLKSIFESMGEASERLEITFEFV